MAITHSGGEQRLPLERVQNPFEAGKCSRLSRGSVSDGLAAIADLWESAQESFLLVLGEAGIGKTRLLEKLVASTTQDVVVLRANPAQSRFAMTGLELFAEWMSEDLLESVTSAVLGESDSASYHAAANEIHDHIRSRKLPPTFLVIDDIDLMDHGSQVIVGINAGRLRGTGLRVVATATRVERHGPLAAIPRFELQPMSTEELVDIATSQDPEGDESTFRIVAGYAGGNPRIFSDLLAQLKPTHRRDHAPMTMFVPASETLDRVVRPTMSTLSPEGRAMLEKVAVAPMIHSSVLIGEDRDAAAVLEDLIDISVLHREAGWVDIVDPRVRLHLHSAMGAHARNSIHVELAQLDDQADGHLVAWHRSFGSDAHDDVDELLAGALWLVHLGRLAGAVELADRALSRAANLAAHSAALLPLCVELLRVGQLGLAARYATRALPDKEASPQSMALAVVTFTSHLFDGSEMVDADVMSIIRLHSASDPYGAVSLLVIASLRRAERWQLSEARSFLDEADQIGGGTDQSIEALRIMRAMVDTLNGTLPSKAYERVDVQQLKDGRFIPDVLLLKVRLLTVQEQYADARTVISAVLNDPRGFEGGAGQAALLTQALNEIAAGEFRLALAAVSGLRTSAPLVSRGSAAYAYYRAWVAYSCGRVEEAGRHLATCLDRAIREADLAMRARGLALRGALRVMVRDFEGAVSDLREVTVLSARFPNPALLRHAADYVEACVLTGRIDEARSALERLEDLLADHESRWGQLALLRCRALVEQGDEALEIFGRAVDAFQQDESPYELGRTLLALAERQTSLGGAESGRRSQIAAFSAFVRSGADGWAQRSASVSRPADARTRVLDQFNDEEREVIRLVLAGTRTREIAGALHLSIRTVELRLTSIYRAMGVSSRAQLIASLAE